MSDIEEYPRMLYKGGKATYAHNSGDPQDDYVIVADKADEDEAGKNGYSRVGAKSEKAEKPAK